MMGYGCHFMECVGQKLKVSNQDIQGLEYKPKLEFKDHFKVTNVVQYKGYHEPFNHYLRWVLMEASIDYICNNIQLKTNWVTYKYKLINVGEK